MVQPDLDVVLQQVAALHEATHWRMNRIAPSLRHRLAMLERAAAGATAEEIAAADDLALAGDIAQVIRLTRYDDPEAPFDDHTVARIAKREAERPGFAALVDRVLAERAAQPPEQEDR